MWRRVLEIARKEVYQTVREPRMRVVLFIPPLLQLIVFGYAVNLDVENSRLAWLDRDRTPQSRRLRADFEGSTYFSIVYFPDSAREIDTLMERGDVEAALVIPQGFARDVARGRPAPVQVLVEGANSNTAAVVSNYVSRLVLGFGSGPAAPRVESRSRVWFNPSLRSQDYFVPGVVVNIIGLVGVMLTAMAVVREKEIGTMEQLMVTPIRPLELMLGKTLPFAAVALVDLFLITALSLALFDIPFRGSPFLLLASALLFLLTVLGAGLLISTVSSTQQQAVMGTFFFFMPAFMLSGFAFPIRNMPLPIQYLTWLNPMRYFLEIVRGIFLKGVGADVLWPQMLALALFGAAMVGLSSARFRKRLD